ncbi:MAG: CDP-glycerol glycerophosphotransferase family protein [Bacilli bacterium]|jgi:CDP-glycerol glycerophosphotransferase|nr:CDP-glycerol glycerophosphotransferase family protein [Bacilli bacterium]
MKKIFFKIHRTFKLIFTRIRYVIYYRNRYQIDDNLIFLESFQGRNFSDNPRALFDYLKNNKEFNNYNFVISFRKHTFIEKFCEYENYMLDASTLNSSSFNFLKTIKEYQLNDRIKLIQYQKRPYYRYMAQAKYIISCSVFDQAFKIKEHQFYLQTWHGTPLKKLGWDIDVKGDNNNRSVLRTKISYELDARRYSLMCSPSKFYSKHISSAFALKKVKKENVMKLTGYPRNDYLVNNNNSSYILSLKDKYNIPHDKKVILYAPTWRENDYKVGEGYCFDLKLDLVKLRELFSKNCILILRIHYLIRQYLTIDEDDDFIYDLSKDVDIRDLYLMSDVMITDYSSTMFDYAILNRPILLYMYDLETYQNLTRGFYFDIKKLPFNISQNMDELVNDLKDSLSLNIDYKAKYLKFNKMFNPLEDGNSAKRTIEELFKLK